MRERFRQSAQAQARPENWGPTRPVGWSWAGFSQPEITRLFRPDPNPARPVKCSGLGVRFQPEDHMLVFKFHGHSAPASGRIHLVEAGGSGSKINGAWGVSPADGFTMMALACPWWQASIAALLEDLMRWSSLWSLVRGVRFRRLVAAFVGDGSWVAKVPGTDCIF
jgi:hypothetical protein